MKLFKKKHQPKEHRSTPKKGRMFILHRRQITVVSLFILVAVAGYLNWSFQQDAVDPDVAAVYSEVSKKIGEAQMVSGTADAENTNQTEHITTVPNDYFVQARLERDVKRSEAMDMLSEILNAEKTDKEARAQAEEEIQRMADFTEKEMMTENMIRAKGYAETVVFMGENLISIAVKSEGLNEIDAAVLRDVAISVTNYSGDKVKIVEIK